MVKVSVHLSVQWMVFKSIEVHLSSHQIRNLFSLSQKLVVSISFNRSLSKITEATSADPVSRHYTACALSFTSYYTTDEGGSLFSTRRSAHGADTDVFTNVLPCKFLQYRETKSVKRSTEFTFSNAKQRNGSCDFWNAWCRRSVKAT